MQFSELSDHAKDTARTLYTSGDYLGYGWWDGVYERATKAAKILGIEIDEVEGQPIQKMPTGFKPSIFFSGFSSQGDGACFEGYYRFAHDAVAKIKEFSSDVELIDFAERLTALQMARRIRGFEPFMANIYTNGSLYLHSGTICVGVEFEEDEEDPSDAIYNQVLQIMRDFADWIYKELNEEYDWLHSPECVDEALADKEFDEHGSLI